MTTSKAPRSLQVSCTAPPPRSGGGALLLPELSTAGRLAGLFKKESELS
jgi:hypothetical protein